LKKLKPFDKKWKRYSPRLQLRTISIPFGCATLVETDDPDQESKLYLGTNMEVSISQMRTIENEYRPGRSASRIATTKRLSQIRQHRKRH
jgi:hypothetical protein